MKFLFLIILVVLASCGKDVCILGMGNCSTTKPKDNLIGPTPTSTLLLSSDKRDMKYNEDAIVTASGGTPDYTFSKSTTCLGNLVATNKTQVKYTSINQEEDCRIKVTDAKSATYTTTLSVHSTR